MNVHSTNYAHVYEDDPLLSKLKEAYHNASGQTKSSIGRAIEDREEELREEHRES